jgi:hypothetical protein
MWCFSDSYSDVRSEAEQTNRLDQAYARIHPMQSRLFAFRQPIAVAPARDFRKISAIETVDQRHYDEAEGWLELGNLAEAEAALDLISPGVCKRPAVLEMRFHICAQTDRWDEAYELGKGCLFIEPDGPNGPVLHTHALHKLGRSAEPATR